MNKQIAEDIYWVLATKVEFTLMYPSEISDDYSRLKKERVKISNRCSELKKTHPFDDSARIATVEWLEGYVV